MNSAWNPDDFFEEDNWKKNPGKHSDGYKKELQKKEEELQLKEQKDAEKLLIFNFLLTQPHAFSVEIHGLEEEVRKIISRNGGDGITCKVSVFKQNKPEIVMSGPVKFSTTTKLAKVVIDPFPAEARLNLINEIIGELELTFGLVSDESRESFVYARVMKRREAEMNF